ncbi:Regulator of chromosome condensation RCC1 (Precursor), related [Neospora caninum Liverpool]|uniref:Regulator of chromosome condensation RCC1 (Precursor), related n=1 Tax=Neospora caninum (strain Liverpool) TaxID=572307 RepID=F0VNI9_NEOCL|nr:Regulator of chromosome condensation RCC1 (Precursor), related [Neospora caninum Liverpool]CBZ55285.1 Regulator of chromosome condensation RCC1 (Precursor), related [Neospora caninum Liverpool]|eukprot:XP_003885313.1 Regulator of chromosome condensation RCC1 (Precursor), related [Neospora caninum Liverpool]
MQDAATSSPSSRVGVPATPGEESAGEEERERRGGDQEETVREEESDGEEERGQRTGKEARQACGQRRATGDNADGDEKGERSGEVERRREEGAADARGNLEHAHLAEFARGNVFRRQHSGRSKEKIRREIRAYGSLELHTEIHTPEEGAVLAGLQSRQGDEVELPYGAVRRAASCPVPLEDTCYASLLDETPEEVSSSEEEGQNQRGEERKDDVQARRKRQRLCREDNEGQREETERKGGDTEQDGDGSSGGEGGGEEGEEAGEYGEEGEQIWDFWGGEGPSEEDLHLLELLVGEGIRKPKRERKKRRKPREKDERDGAVSLELREESTTEEDQQRKSTSSGRPLSSAYASDELDHLLARAAAGEIQDEVFVIKKKTLVLSFVRAYFPTRAYLPLSTNACNVIQIAPTLSAAATSVPPSSLTAHAPSSPLAGPSSAQAFKPATVSRVFCGRSHSAALTEDGCVLLWGNNAAGQLGRGGFAGDEEEAGGGSSGLRPPGLSARPERRARFEPPPHYSRRTPRQHGRDKETDSHEEARVGRGTESTTADGSQLRDDHSALSVSSLWSPAGSAATRSASSASSAVSSPASRTSSSPAAPRRGFMGRENGRWEEPRGGGAEAGKARDRLLASSLSFASSSTLSSLRGANRNPSPSKGEAGQQEAGREHEGEEPGAKEREDKEQGPRDRTGAYPERVRGRAIKPASSQPHSTVPKTEEKDERIEEERPNIAGLAGKERTGVARGLPDPASPEPLNSAGDGAQCSPSRDSFEDVNPSPGPAACRQDFSPRLRRSSSCPRLSAAGLPDAALEFGQTSVPSPSSAACGPLASSSGQASAGRRRPPWYKRLFGKCDTSSPPVSRETGERGRERENDGDVPRWRMQSTPPSVADASPASSASRGVRQVLDFFTGRGRGRNASQRRSSSTPVASGQIWEGGPATPQMLASRALTEASLRRSAKRGKPSPPGRDFEWKPVLVREFGTVYRVIDVALGGEHSMFLCQDGSLWLCGSNLDGQLGLLAKRTRQPITFAGRPRRMPLGDAFDWPEYRRIASPVAFIAAGYKHSALIDAKDRLWMWGNNRFGQCGMDPGTTASVVMLPWRVRFPQKGISVVQIALGKYHSLCLTEDGQVFVWGRGRFGVLGAGLPKQTIKRSWLFARRQSLEPLFVCTPQPLRALCSVHVTRIASGDSHCAAVGVARLSRNAYAEVALLQLQEQGAAYRDYVLGEMKKRSAQYIASSSLGHLAGRAFLLGASPAIYGSEPRLSLPFRSRPVDGFFFSSRGRRQPNPTRGDTGPTGSGVSLATRRTGDRRRGGEPGRDEAAWPQLGGSSSAHLPPRTRAALYTPRGRRRSLLMLMSPAQRYRARLFHETKRDSWSRGGTETDDELRLSDLERRRRWGFPEGVGEPYGTERGSAAHRGGDQLFLWGKGTEGELGCNTLRNQYSPVELPFVLSSSRPCYIQVHEVALGGDFTLTVAASYSTSFMIRDPVPSPSPREGAAATRTLLDIYRGKPSVFSAPFPSGGAVHARRQSFVSWSTDTESRLASPKSPASPSSGSLHSAVSPSPGHAVLASPPPEDTARRLAESRSLDWGGSGRFAGQWGTIPEGAGSEEDENEGTKRTDESERKAGESKEAPLWVGSSESGLTQKTNSGAQEASVPTADIASSRTGCAAGSGASRAEVALGDEARVELGGDGAGGAGAAGKEEPAKVLCHGRREERENSEQSPGEGEGDTSHRTDTLAATEACQMKEEKSNPDAEAPGFGRGGVCPSAPTRRRPQASPGNSDGEEDTAWKWEGDKRDEAGDASLRRDAEQASPKQAPESLPVLSVAPPPSEDPPLPKSLCEFPPRHTDRDRYLSSSSLSPASPSSKSASSSPYLTPGSPATSQRGSVFQLVPSIGGRSSVPFLCVSSFYSPSDRFLFSPSQAAATSVWRPLADSKRASTWSRGSVVSSGGSAGGGDAFLSAIARAVDPHLPLQLYVWGSNRGNQLPLEPEEPQPTFLVPHRVNLLSLVDATILARRTPSLCLRSSGRGAAGRDRRAAPRVVPREIGAGHLRAAGKSVGSDKVHETRETDRAREDAPVGAVGTEGREGETRRQAPAEHAQSDTLDRPAGARDSSGPVETAPLEGRRQRETGLGGTRSPNRTCLQGEEAAEGRRETASSRAGEAERRQSEQADGDTQLRNEGDQREDKPREERDHPILHDTTRRGGRAEPGTGAEDAQSVRSNSVSRERKNGGGKGEVADPTEKGRATSQSNEMAQAFEERSRLREAHPSERTFRARETVSSSSDDENLFSSAEKPAPVSPGNRKDVSALESPRTRCPHSVSPSSSRDHGLEKQSVPRPGAQEALLRILNALDAGRSEGNKSPVETDKTNASNLCSCPAPCPEHGTCTLLRGDPQGSTGYDCCSRIEQRDRAIKLRTAASAALAYKLSSARRSCRGSGTPDLLWALPSLAGRHSSGGAVGIGGEAKTMARRRKIYVAGGGVWRAICSVKIKSVAAGQEHSLIVVEVEYLEAHKTAVNDVSGSPQAPRVQDAPSGFQNA